MLRPRVTRVLQPARSELLQNTIKELRGHTVIKCNLYGVYSSPVKPHFFFMSMDLY